MNTDRLIIGPYFFFNNSQTIFYGGVYISDKSGPLVMMDQPKLENVISLIDCQVKITAIQNASGLFGILIEQKLMTRFNSNSK